MGFHKLEIVLLQNQKYLGFPSANSVTLRESRFE